jgi:hypothetical protein
VGSWGGLLGSGRIIIIIVIIMITIIIIIILIIDIIIWVKIKSSPRHQHSQPDRLLWLSLLCRHGPRRGAARAEPRCRCHRPPHRHCRHPRCEGVGLRGNRRLAMVAKRSASPRWMMHVHLIRPLKPVLSMPAPTEVRGLSVA